MNFLIQNRKNSNKHNTEYARSYSLFTSRKSSQSNNLEVHVKENNFYFDNRNLFLCLIIDKLQCHQKS